MEFLYTQRFLRSLKKIPPEVQEDVFDVIDRFRDKGNHEALRLHKLTGRMKKYHAFSVNFAYRIIIEITKEGVYFIDMGTHDVYR